MLFFPKKAILAKIESVYGTDSVPTGAANAILARNLSIVPLNAELHKREVVLPVFGDLGAIPGSAHVTVEFEVELAGGGAAGTAPPWGPLVRACARAETISAGVDALYAPVAGAFEAVSIYFHLDGLRHRLTGCRGKLALSLNHDAIPVLKFSMVAIYNAPTDTALPTLTLTAWQKPLPVNKVNTPTFTLHTYAAVLSSLEIDDGTVVNFKDYVNAAEEVRVGGRPGVTGTAKVEAKLLATKDWFALARAGTMGALNLIHGTAAGNKVQIEAAQVQIGNPTYEDADGVAMLNLPLMFNITPAGNNEYTIRVL
ncbi:MAG: hypothetical protein NUV51_01090 [Sulfuricaulis sp.]|nr:hypothetical protein [Sulfuricaulis sp.]